MALGVMNKRETDGFAMAHGANTLHAERLSEGATRLLLDALASPSASQLQSVELIGCWHLFEWPPGLSLTRLRTLRIVGSRLQSAPDLTKCVALEEVDLHDNQIGPSIGEVPWLPHGGGAVVTIDLSYNKLHRVDDWAAAFAFGRDSNLLSVDVSFNFLKRGPPPGSMGATQVATHHNEMDNREHCRGVLFSLAPATNLWTSPRTGGLTAGLLPQLPPGSPIAFHRPIQGGMGVARQVREIQEQLRQGQEQGAYAQRQSVHNTTVQKGARDAIDRVLALSRPYPRIDTPELLKRVRAALYPDPRWWWQRALRFALPAPSSWRCIESSCGDVTTVYGAGGTYAELLERVWAIVERHEHRDLLCTRLREEAEESAGMCFTGRATRLLNVLHGVVEGVHLGVSDREAMQARIAAVLARLGHAQASPTSPTASKDGVVEKLRNEMQEALDGCPGLSVDERAAWLEAFDSSLG